MKKIYTYLREISLIIALLVLATAAGWGQDGYDPETGKPILGPELNRRALVRPNCIVNTLWEDLSILGGTKDLNNLLDDNLTNYVEIGGLAEIDVQKELIRVKDIRNYYRKGTTVGFCIEASGGLLNLDVLKIFNIMFYKDGKLVGSSETDSGETGGGLLDVGLIQLPSNAVSMLAVKAPEDLDTEYFDEIALCVGGLSVDISSVRIRYAFAGDVQTYTLTENNAGSEDKVLGKTLGITDISNIGMVWDDDAKRGANFINSSLDDYLEAFDAVGSSVTIQWDKEFPKGTEVGFNYRRMGLLAADMGPVGRITLYKDGVKTSDEVFLDASVLSLGLFEDRNHTSSIIATESFNGAKFEFFGGIKLTGTHYYYGFINEAPIIPSEDRLEVGMDATICLNETTYYLRPQSDNWKLDKVTNDKEGEDVFEDSSSIIENVNFNPGADAEGNPVTIVSGLEENAYYHFSVVEDGKKGSLILNHGVKTTSSCNVAIDTKDYEIGSSVDLNGGISILGGVKDKENIVDGNNDTYAECTAGIELIGNQHIIGVKKKSGTISDGTEDKRIGFLVEIEDKLLDLSALNFFRIQLFNEGEPIRDLEGKYVVKDWNIVSAGLIGSENASKTRLGVTVPAGIQFDEFALYSAGIASVRLSTMRIYSAFVEDAAASCDNPLACDVVYAGEEGMMDNAYIDYEMTNLPEGVSALTSMTGLENLVSGKFDPNSSDNEYVQYIGTLNVLSNPSIAVNFGRIMDKTHQAGFVVDKQTFLLNASVISGTVISTYLKGVKQESSSNWSVVDANVIGYGDYTYLMFTPTMAYDEVRLEFPALVEIFSTIKIYSVFIRNDLDGDGIPDFMDPDCCSGGLSAMSISPKDICLGDKMVFSVLPDFREESRDYIMTITNSNTNGSELIVNPFTIPSGNVYQYEIMSGQEGGLKVAGEYVLEIKENESSASLATLNFTIHPTRTTWNDNISASETSTDWNEWTNWTEGSPWTCTDVIIPSDADTYPVLKSGVMNGCRYIHFEPNAEVVNTHRLTYEKAWVELALHPNRYYMVTVPLKDTYSGDWFWNDLDKVDHFTALNDETLPEKRVTPTIYQRVWDFPVTDVINSNGTQTQVKSTQWSLPYNYLATKYETNSGGYNFNAVSVWVHPSTPANNEEGDGNGVYKFRFPKEHTLYYYYDKNGSSVGLSESIKRNKAQAGRFIYESEDSTVTFPYVMRFTNDQMQSGEHDVFFVGNPFMSHIDVNRFYEVNPHLTDILVGADNQYKHLEYKEASTGVIATSDVIAPMQSFLVRQEGDAPSCTITFTEEMLVSAPKIKLTSSPEEAPTIEKNTISITASASDTRSSAMIRFSASASDNYREREDAEILIENETPPAVAIFTTAEDRALDIQQRANGGEIPLGMYLPKPEDVTLRIAVPDEYSGWMVEDVETNRRYPLMPGEETEIHVGRLTTNVGRFYLKGQSATGNETITVTQPKLYCYREAGSHTLVVRSGSEMMTRCEVYGMDGRLRHIGQFETDEYRFPAQKGVQIVKAYFKDGITSTVKVF